MGEAFNFGTELPLSVIAMAEHILAAVGVSPPLTIMNQASNEIPRQYLDCRKARERLGWQPRHDISGALRETVTWYRAWLARGAAR